MSRKHSCPRKHKEATPISRLLPIVLMVSFIRHMHHAVALSNDTGVNVDRLPHRSDSAMFDSHGNATHERMQFAFRELSDLISVTFTASGEWNAPLGITTVSIKCWGGGASGGGSSQAGSGVAMGDLEEVVEHMLLPKWCPCPKAVFSMSKLGTRYRVMEEKTVWMGNLLL